MTSTTVIDNIKAKNPLTQSQSNCFFFLTHNQQMAYVHTFITTKETSIGSFRILAFMLRSGFAMVCQWSCIMCICSCLTLSVARSHLSPQQSVCGPTGLNVIDPIYRGNLDRSQSLDYHSNVCCTLWRPNYQDPSGNSQSIWFQREDWARWNSQVITLVFPHRMYDAMMGKYSVHFQTWCYVYFKMCRMWYMLWNNWVLLYYTFTLVWVRVRSS